MQRSLQAGRGEIARKRLPSGLRAQREKNALDSADKEDPHVKLTEALYRVHIEGIA